MYEKAIEGEVINTSDNMRTTASGQQTSGRHRIINSN